MSKFYALIFVLAFYLLQVLVVPIVGATLLIDHGQTRALMNSNAGPMDTMTYWTVLTGIFHDGFDSSLGYLSVFTIFMNLVTGGLVLLILRGD